LKPSEYLMIWVGTTIGVPVVMFLLSFVVPTLGNPILLLIGLAIGFFIPRFWLGRRKNGRLNAFNKQLPDTITLIANALRAGSSFLQAIELVVRESRPPVSTEFGRVIREVNLGLSFDVALENMVRRVKSDDLELMATAIAIQHTVGGNLAEILDSIAFTIRERVRIKGEIRTLTAQQRLSGYVVGFLPIGLAGFLFIAAPDFMKPMFDNRVAVGGLPLGVIILAIGGFSMFMGFMFIRKIVDIEV
jgi:tight adherence protein B